MAAPKAPTAPVLPAPPWEARRSVADTPAGSAVGDRAARPATGTATAPPAPAVVIRNATLMLATGKTIEHGTIVLQGGKIAAVGPSELETPAGATVIDGTGKFVTPGLIDTHSHIGVYAMPDAHAHEDGNEATDPITPQVHTIDAFWPQDPSIERAVAGGVTTIQVLPGSANLIGGRAVTLKLYPHRSARDMHFPGAPDGLKMACGENPKRVYGQSHRMPSTRMGNLAVQRAAFLKAQKLERDWARWRSAETHRAMALAKKRAAYEAKREEREKQQAFCRTHGSSGSCRKWRAEWSKPLEEPDPTEPMPSPDRDMGMETLTGALAGRVLVHIHCYRADDMLDMIALAEEMGFKIRSFHHSLEAYKIRDVLKDRGIAVSTWADWWGFKMEAFDGIPENAALLHEAGARPIIHSDSAEGIQRLNQEAGKALAAGRRGGISLTEADAIRWITLYPAWALGIDDRTGSLEVGKDADVVLWNKNPFSVYAAAEKVWIDGAPVYSRGAPHWSDFEVQTRPGPEEGVQPQARTSTSPQSSGQTPAQTRGGAR
jgi:imidazolonepropionase-like amidohydrolase